MIGNLPAGHVCCIETTGVNSSQQSRIRDAAADLRCCLTSMCHCLALVTIEICNLIDFTARKKDRTHFFKGSANVDGNMGILTPIPPLYSRILDTVFLTRTERLRNSCISCCVSKFKIMNTNVAFGLIICLYSVRLLIRLLFLSYEVNDYFVFVFVLYRDNWTSDFCLLW